MTVICPENALGDDQSKGFSVGGLSLVLVKKEGVVYAYENRCPHLGINLEYMEDQFLDLDKAFIVCSNHGALFEIDTGSCVVGPCKGQSLRRVAVEIVDGNIALAKQASV